MRVREKDLKFDDGQTLHVYDTDGSEQDLTVLWHHGTPNIGRPPDPLFDASTRLGVRWISYDRPGYGGSTVSPDRTIASAATYASRTADALGIERFAVMGHSGGGPHALACAALLPERVSGAVSLAGLAPFDADGLDWFAGMITSGVASLQAATGGRAVKETHETSGAEYDPEFTVADHETLSREWGTFFGTVVGSAVESGPDGVIDDDIAYVTRWGVNPACINVPTLLLHGGEDRIAPSAHSEWLSRRCPTSELRLFPDDGHISILDHAEAALEWLASSSEPR